MRVLMIADNTPWEDNGKRINPRLHCRRPDNFSIQITHAVNPFADSQITDNKMRAAANVIGCRGSVCYCLRGERFHIPPRCL